MNLHIHWFRQDLRLSDNPSLLAACQAGAVLPIYILDDDNPKTWRMGGAARVWLHHSLAALDADLRDYGNRLLLLRGDPLLILPALLQQSGASAVHWQRQYEPWAIARDSQLKTKLQQLGYGAHSHPGRLLYEPHEIKNGSGEPYRVYTPFAKACRALRPVDSPLPAPGKIPSPARYPDDVPLSALELLPTKPDWAGGIRAAWQPGAAGAAARLSDFLEDGLAGYAEGRDRPDLRHYSGLSPHLHFGEISPRQVWHAAAHRAAADGLDKDELKFHNELLWREFSYYLLYHFPHLPHAPFNPAYADFPWADDSTLLHAWQRGQTGYPLVDAGMRQLWQTGFIHNRVRMVVASFLVKHLLQPWQAGAAWFWDTLVDADLANNSASWQWVAGCGADAAPYFRIFNPIMQGEKFDPKGEYVRRFVPELARLPDKFIHQPWTAPLLVLQAAGVELGKTYPQPIIAHEVGRDRAMAAWQRLRAGAAA